MALYEPEDDQAGITRRRFGNPGNFTGGLSAGYGTTIRQTVDTGPGYTTGPVVPTQQDSALRLRGGPAGPGYAVGPPRMQETYRGGVTTPSNMPPERTEKPVQPFYGGGQGVGSGGSLSRLVWGSNAFSGGDGGVMGVRRLDSQVPARVAMGRGVRGGAFGRRWGGGRLGFGRGNRLSWILSSLRQ